VRPGCGAPILMAIVVVAGLSGKDGAVAQQPQLQRFPPIPVISCDVSSPSVTAGQSVEITTRVIEGDAAGLKYSFETSAGRLTIVGPNASTARLDTANVTNGEIRVRCVVVDAYGRKFSNDKIIRLGDRRPACGPAQPRPRAPKNPPKTEKIEVPEMHPAAPSAAPPPPPQPTFDAKPPAPERTEGVLVFQRGRGIRPRLDLYLLARSPPRIRARTSMPRGWRFRGG